MENDVMYMKAGIASGRIREAVKAVGLNHINVAYSGGNDSKVVLKLARHEFPNMMAIHNGHPGESVGDDDGVLIVREPKVSMVPVFLASVEMYAQLDGTRMCEDKEVMFDGENIHRSEMPNGFTQNGVFSQHVYFPIWDWSDDDVTRFLEEWPL